MTWNTWLKSSDELVIDGRTIVRIAPNSPNAKILIDLVKGAVRHDIVKRPRTDLADG